MNWFAGVHAMTMGLLTFVALGVAVYLTIEIKQMIKSPGESREKIDPR